MSEAHSPINAMIDAATRCVNCGAAGQVGSCGCWVRLECPVCNKVRWCAREPDDGDDLARVVYPCPDHRETHPDAYAADPQCFDADGLELPLPEVAF